MNFRAGLLMTPLFFFALSVYANIDEVTSSEVEETYYSPADDVNDLLFAKAMAELPEGAEIKLYPNDYLVAGGRPGACSCSSIRTSGKATYYKPTGNRTASGDVYSSATTALRAAHRCLDWGSKVTACLTLNRKEVCLKNVVINDTGGFGGSTLLDLNLAARNRAGKDAFIHAGRVPLRITKCTDG